MSWPDLFDVTLESSGLASDNFFSSLVSFLSLSLALLSLEALEMAASTGDLGKLVVVLVVGDLSFLCINSFVWIAGAEVLAGELVVVVVAGSAVVVVFDGLFLRLQRPFLFLAGCLVVVVVELPLFSFELCGVAVVVVVVVVMTGTILILSGARVVLPAAVDSSEAELSPDGLCVVLLGCDILIRIGAFEVLPPSLAAVKLD